MGIRSIATYILSPSFKNTQPYLAIYMYNIPYRYDQELMKEGASNCVERHLNLND